MQTVNQKADERKRLLKLRKAFPEKREKEKLIAENLFESILFKTAEEIFVYISVDFEIDTSSIIERAFSDEKKVFVPVCRKNGEMVFQRIEKDEKLVLSSFGIPEPEVDVSRSALPGERSLIVVPGLAFDKSGNRIGFGGGYYDRFLSGIEAESIGLCFEEFFVPALPKEKFDVPVNYLATEKDIYSFQE